MFRAAILVLVIGLAGCGFRPLYEGRGDGSVRAMTGSIEVQPISDRSGQLLRNHLLDRLNPRGAPASARYSLAVEMNESIRELAIRKDEVATRANMTLTATYRLIRLADGRPVNKATVQSTVSYNILQNDFATISARKDARERGIRDLSEVIEIRLALFMARERSTAQKKPE